MTYKVKINRTSKGFRKLSIQIGTLALLGFFIWYMIDLPVRQAPAEIGILYYFQFLPNWMLNIFGVTLILALISVLLFDIRINTRAYFGITPEMLTLQSKGSTDRILFSEIKRINFVTNFLTLNPYRIEFIYSDNSFKRIKLGNKQDFYKIMNDLYSVAPQDFNFNVTSFESMEQQTPFS